jgi:hypothetical protein
VGKERSTGAGPASPATTGTAKSASGALPPPSVAGSADKGKPADKGPADKGPADKGPADKDKADKDKADKDPADKDSADKDKAEAAKSTAGESAEAAKTGAKPSDATPAKASTGADTSSIMVRIVPGITRYHKEDCLLIRFLAADDLEVMSLKSASDEGYFACKACKPDQLTADAAK